MNASSLAAGYTIPPQIAAILPLLVSFIPEYQVLNGKRIELRKLVGKILEDGKLDAADALTVLAAIAGAQPIPAPVQPPTPVVLPPAPVVVVPGPRPPVAAAKLYPAGLGFDFDLTDNNGAPCGFKVEDKGDYYEVIKTDGTSNMPRRGKAYLHAGYYDAQGVPINFEERGALHLYGTAQWVSREIGGAGRLSELRSNQGDKESYLHSDAGSERIVNWNNEAELPKEARRTGGMDVPMKFPDEADGAVIETYFFVDTPNGRVQAKPVRWPKVS